MFKTPELYKTINKLTYQYRIENSIPIKIGSFFRKEKKYITDIDIGYLIRCDDLSCITTDIIPILQKVKNNPNILFKIIYCGNLQYSDKITGKYLNELYEKGLLTKDIVEKIQNLIDLKFPSEVIEKKLKFNLRIKWEIDDIIKGFKIVDGKKYKFKDELNKGQIKVFIIYKFKNYKIPIELFYRTYKSYKQEIKKNKKNIYHGCKLPQGKFSFQLYYQFLRRLKSCYYKNKNSDKLSNEQKEYVNKTYDEINLFMKDKEIIIVQYYSDIVKYTLESNTDELTNVNKVFNLHFKEYATKLYYEGKKKNVIF
jgi:hypothetical protein